MADYLLMEDGSRLLLEDGSGSVLIEDADTVTYWSGGVSLERGTISPHDYHVGARLRW